MELLVSKIALHISTQLGYDENRKSVITYGLLAISQILSIAVIITVLSTILKTVPESYAIFLTVGLLRKSTGGSHAETMERCIIISVLSIIFLSLASRYMFYVQASYIAYVIISIFLFSLYFIIAYKKVPVGSTNKPIVSDKKIKRLRKNCFITLSIYFVLVFTLFFFSQYYDRCLSIATAIHFGILWQIMTLTKPGAKFMNAFDTIVYKMAKV